jgi:hypothetical protein
MITLKKLKEMNPCENGLKWYEQNIKTEDEREVLIQLNNYNPYWSRWLMVRLLDDNQRRKLAIFSAKLALPIFEKKYPEDKRVRECIEAAEKIANFLLWLSSNNLNINHLDQ